MTLIDPHEVEILRVEPGDVAVLTMQRSLSKLELDRLRAEWETIWRGAGHDFVPNLVVLDGGVDLKVLRRDEIATDGLSG